MNTKVLTQWHPQFSVVTDSATIGAIRIAGLRHYDGHCKASADTGGFLGRWERTLRTMEEMGGSFEPYVTATFSELGTVLKICEPRPYQREQDIERIFAFSKAVRSALIQSNVDYHKHNPLKDPSA